MNRLSKEKSPYLLQHAENPVDWFPWSEEAFDKARKENKPVFLSIGYATCHWCHVMAHESFEDDEVARLMNEAFVNIKVDREERPDIDNTYMTVCQMLTGQGGWPLTIIMTPDKEPFFAATYLPKRSMQNRIGMTDLVPQIKNAWQNDRQRIDEAVKRIKEGFSKSLHLGQSNQALPENITEDTFQNLKNRYDPEFGGFGGSPKFPSPHNLLFLADYAHIHEHDEAKEMVGKTLLQMRLGGLWDHIGKGFHRYSTDHEWLLPHFEKMLYDQATLLMAFAEGWKLTGEPLFKETALDIVDYVESQLKSPDGLFYSAEDADSEGEEGKFYVWSREEIDAVLTDEESDLFCKHYNIRSEGNFLDESTRQRTGKNIPHLSHLLTDLEESKLTEIRQKLNQQREKRIRPLLDDKILTDWNGLMIAALAKSGVLLNETELIEKAEKAFKQLLNLCKTEQSLLLHRIKDGEAEIEGMADDYAFLIWGATELCNATFDPGYLSEAVELQKRFTEHFADQKHGGFFYTAEHAEVLLGRQKEIYDGAIPSSNSVAVYNGYKLSRLTGQSEFEHQVEQILTAFSEQISDAPAGYTFAIYAHQVIQQPSNEILITAEKVDEKTNSLLNTAREFAGTGSVILLKTVETSDQLGAVAPFAKSYPIKEKPAVYVCSNFSCRAPVFDMESLKNLLQN
ncbi:thioredoxin domain-containing protein [Rhodohalobacter barkolensis]|uniref:Thioredoxin domain-containing protein n=1 Tax=Rhodohalobacter barkolensis TaxID=2053187 RepID=A0A2N0VIB1_9BACT|nr:thioredoxin domain-containing protein [Rhodohalobacter barkolensis]PKD43926.1 thioredoxin domain-containing protein [Rhodohalobacter barkolensis]